MTIKDYLGVIRQRTLVVLLAIVLTTSSAILLALRQTPEYTSTARLLVVPLALVGSGETLQSKYQFQRSVTTEAEIVRSTLVASRVIKKLGLDRPPYQFDPQELLERVEIMNKQWTEVLEISVTAPNPVLAAEIANAFPREYISSRQEEALKQAQAGSQSIAEYIQQLLDRMGVVEAELKRATPGSSRAELLERNRSQLVGEMASQEATRQKLIDSSPLKTGVGELLEEAKPSKARSNADLMKTGILGLVIGIPLALGLALLLDAMSDTIKNREEAERIVGIEALGVIPLTPEWRSSKPYVVSREAPYSAAAEAFRTLRINLDSLLPDSAAKRILFTSPGMSEGKTTTTANLGVAYAESGRSALLVSADLRRPKLHNMFGVEASPGLTDVITDDQDPANLVVESSPNLYLLPSGSPVERPDQMLSRADVRVLLEKVSVVPSSSRRSRPRNDENGQPLPADPARATKRSKVYAQPSVTLVDAPAILGAAEVSSLAPAVDGVVLVLQAGITKREAAARAADQIRRAGGKLLGIVMVGVRIDNDYSSYPPVDDDMSDSGDSAWSKVVGALRS